MFKRTLQRYGDTPEPETPYQKAAQVWDRRIGAAAVQAANWRLMAFGSLLVAIAAVSLWNFGMNSRVTWRPDLARNEARASGRPNHAPDSMSRASHSQGHLQKLL